MVVSGSKATSFMGHLLSVQADCTHQSATHCNQFPRGQNTQVRTRGGRWGSPVVWLMPGTISQGL